MVILKEKILDFKIAKNALFVMINKKIVLFENATLKYVCTFEDVDMSFRNYCVGYNINPIVMAYSSGSNKSIIRLNKSKI